ncbi:MAG: hypothetical protein HC803_07550 [Saprospiraceae bacterium]|nr:hypothetical protein [Saprospiraceae bacterium]
MTKNICQTPTNGSGSGRSSGSGAGSGSGSDAKSIVINIQKMTGIETLSTINLKESTTSLERTIHETLIKIIRDVEIIS